MYPEAKMGRIFFAGSEGENGSQKKKKKGTILGLIDKLD
jgi:hypothetical protein